jgi:hypothetical protein
VLRKKAASGRGRKDAAGALPSRDSVGPSPVELTTKRLRDVQVAVDAFRERHGAYPSSLDELRLEKRYRLDGWGRRIVLRTSGRGYSLVSPGADGIQGTQDDVVIDSGTRG